MFLVVENIEQQSVENRDVIIIPVKNQIERSGRQTDTKNKYVTRTGREVCFPDCFQDKSGDEVRTCGGLLPLVE